MAFPGNLAEGPRTYFIIFCVLLSTSFLPTSMLIFTQHLLPAWHGRSILPSTPSRSTLVKMHPTLLEESTNLIFDCTHVRDTKNRTSTSISFLLLAFRPRLQTPASVFPHVEHCCKSNAMGRAALPPSKMKLRKCLITNCKTELCWQWVCCCFGNVFNFDSFTAYPRRRTRLPPPLRHPHPRLNLWPGVPGRLDLL